MAPDTSSWSVVGWVRARAKKGPPDDNETSLGFPERKEEEEEQKKKTGRRKPFFALFMKTGVGRLLGFDPILEKEKKELPSINS